MSAAGSPKAVIFDLDGTLIDSLEDIADATNFALAQLGFPTHPLNAYRYFVGEGARKLVERAVPEARRTKEAIAACLSVYRARYSECWNTHTRPYSGIPQLLDELTARRVRLSVLSNKPDDSVQHYMREWFSKWRFDPALGAREEWPLKPDPAGALEIAARLSIPPGQCLFLGDTRIDIETALAAGMTPVGALWGFRTRQELEEAGAKSVIASPLDLLRLV